MNIILLSGGSGKRLWPLSNGIRSKQFLKLFQDDEGQFESMVQRVHRQLTKVAPEVRLTIATGRQQKSAILNQIGNKAGVCVEPSRRDTFPAIALASVYAYSELHVSPDDIVIVCPVDPYVQDAYYTALLELEKAAEEGGAAITLIGVRPTYPSEKYGYIIPEEGNATVRRVLAFKEKPSETTAVEYLKQGALWNCGVFAFRLGYMLELLKQYISFDGYADVYSQYDKLPQISFDYAVVEKESNIACIQYDGEWKDIGTWNTLVEEMDTPTIGHAIVSEGCENVNIINELDIPLVTVGLRDVIVAASADGILVSDKLMSSTIKPLVDKIEQRTMFEEKSWGKYLVLYENVNSLTLKLVVKAGKGLSYHSHEDRNEHWMVVAGSGTAVVDGEEIVLSVGSGVFLPKGKPHRLTAQTDMELIEIQYGTKIDDKDKHAHEGR